jgi:hypothetical protein
MSLSLASAESIALPSLVTAVPKAHDTPTEAAALTQKMEVQQVSVYYGKFRALANVSLTVTAG